MNKETALQVALHESSDYQSKPWSDYVTAFERSLANAGYALIPTGPCLVDDGWMITPAIRWAVTGSMRELEQMWVNGEGGADWRRVPWNESK